MGFNIPISKDLRLEKFHIAFINITFTRNFSHLINNKMALNKYKQIDKSYLEGYILLFSYLSKNLKKNFFLIVNKELRYFFKSPFLLKSDDDKY